VLEHKFSGANSLQICVLATSKSGEGYIDVENLENKQFKHFFTFLYRFAAIYRPIMYTTQIQNLKSYAIITLVIVWTISFLIAALPTWLPGFLYASSSAGLIIAPDVSLFFIPYMFLPVRSHGVGD